MMVRPLLDQWKEGRNLFLFNDAFNTFYFTVIWRRTYGNGPVKEARKETRCRHIGYSFRLAARVILYAPSHRQDSTGKLLDQWRNIGWNDKNFSGVTKRDRSDNLSLYRRDKTRSKRYYRTQLLVYLKQVRLLAF